MKKYKLFISVLVSNRAKGRTLYWINPLITISENQKYLA